MHTVLLHPLSQTEVRVTRRSNVTGSPGWVPSGAPRCLRCPPHAPGLPIRYVARWGLRAGLASGLASAHRFISTRGGGKHVSLRGTGWAFHGPVSPQSTPSAPASAPSERVSVRGILTAARALREVISAGSLRGLSTACLAHRIPGRSATAERTRHPPRAVRQTNACLAAFPQQQHALALLLAVPRGTSAGRPPHCARGRPCGPAHFRLVLESVIADGLESGA